MCQLKKKRDEEGFFLLMFYQSKLMSHFITASQNFCFLLKARCLALNTKNWVLAELENQFFKQSITFQRKNMN